MKDDKITNLRAPMVTANGIILGFLLNYMATWVRGDVEHATLCVAGIFDRHVCVLWHSEHDLCIVQNIKCPSG